MCARVHVLHFNLQSSQIPWQVCYKCLDYTIQPQDYIQRSKECTFYLPLSPHFQIRPYQINCLFLISPSSLCHKIRQNTHTNHAYFNATYLEYIISLHYFLPTCCIFMVKQCFSPLCVCFCSSLSHLFFWPWGMRNRKFNWSGLTGGV